MQPGFVDLPNFVGFASREAISDSREISKTFQVGFRQGCDTGLVNELFQFTHRLFVWNILYVNQIY